MTRIRISMSYWSKWNNPPPCRYHNVQQRIVGYKDGGNSTGDLEILIYRICSAPAMWTIGRMMPARWNITVLAKISKVTIVRQDHHTIPVLPVSWGDKEAREASQKVFHLRRVYNLWTDTSSTSTITVIATTGYNLVEAPVFSSNMISL